MKYVILRAITAVRKRLSRNIFTFLAISLSAATLAALLGITASSAAQTAARFSQLESSDIGVSMGDSAWSLSENEIRNKIEALDNVEAVGTLNLPQDSSTVVDVRSSQWGTHLSASVGVVTAAGLAARGAKVVSGVTFAENPLADEDLYTVMLGARLAKELGISMTQGKPLVTVRGVELAVIGIVQDSSTQSVLSTAVLLSPETALRLKMRPTSQSLLVRVKKNTAEAVGSVLARVLNPSNPGDVGVKLPSSPTKLRDSLIADSQSLTFITAGIVTVVSAFSIANTMQVAVVERRKEIGIDMALGLDGRSVAAQFLFESTLLGFAGSLVGMLCGAVIVAGTAMAGGWPFVLPVYTLWIPVFGLVVGALAGAFPAARAAKVNPAELLRSA
ncbi:MAG: ABC transporter permease [Bifidobacteriaceae bacterium]|jgi:putative ABC transport system permease protein|nr:ABC transporter permease [Bifidobacteriaceae bacterium]MCI1978723.1 ABC transporter permease [Bifidobacteriaceae bacterium]